MQALRATAPVTVHRSSAGISLAAPSPALGERLLVPDLDRAVVSRRTFASGEAPAPRDLTDFA